MDEILLSRLTTFAVNIENLAEEAKRLCEGRPWNKEKLEHSHVTASKLQSILNRFNTDLNQYFKLANNPNADEVSNLTVSQLKGEEILAELQTHIKQTASTSKPVENNVTSRRSKLPELNLQVFKGELLNWHPFWDQFQSSIGKRDICDVDKLLYLRASLEGEPKTMIEGLETTNNSYKIAIDILQQRYGKAEQIIDAHYSTLYKLKRAISFEDCRKTFDELERHLRVLQSLGEDINHNHLRFMVLEKFPEDIVYEVKLKGGFETIEDLRKLLDTVITAREEAKGHKEGNKAEEPTFTTEALHVADMKKKKQVFNKNKPRFNRNKFFKKPNHSTSTFAGTSQPKKRPYVSAKEEVNAQPERKKGRIQCAFCQGPHFNDQCTTYKTVEDRLKNLGKRCYRCLRLGHRRFECKSEIRCVHCNTVGKHTRALCPQEFSGQKEPQAVKTLHAQGGGPTVLQTAIISAIGRNGIVKKYRLLLDCGSQRSYVTKKVAKELELEVEEEDHLFVFTFGTDKPQEIKSDLVRICLKLKDNNLKLLYTNVVPIITQGVSSPKEDLLKCVYNHNKNLVLADDNSLLDQVDILIGNDYYHSLIGTQKIKIKENLYLVDSKFGWILSGKPEDKNRNNDDLTVLTYFQTTYENKLCNPDLPIEGANLKNLWELESIGITDSPDTNRDEEAIKSFNETTTFENNRYVVSWPWNEYPPQLSSNYGLAYGRLVSLLKRIDEETLLTYEQTLKDQLSKGIIEVVEDDGNVDHPICYLPHHSVSSSGKALRIVYDASAKAKDRKSLNECLYRGPIMLEDLTGLLIKFRCHKIALTADVEKAFLQLGLHEKDRDVTRFIWLKDFTKPAERENLIIYRFTRVPFGIISSPYLLNAAIQHHLKKSEHEHVRRLANEIYVDNLLTGTENIQDALQLYQDCKSAFEDISMNIREWNSNCKDLKGIIPDINTDHVIKTLGLDWNLEKDTLNIRMKSTNNELTKRGLLKTIASIYDPCGFAAPVILPAKLMLQSLWKENKNWDTPLSKDLAENWKTISKDLEDIREICLPRNMSQATEGEIHCFTDSSLKAYSTVIYLLQENNLQFIIGKSRLAPLKEQENLKIPRLELLAALIGNRLVKYVVKYLPIKVTKQILWCDSQIVISWCQSDKLLAPFVARRVEEIKRNKMLEIRYVPSELNPADVATRPMNSKGELQLWLKGPSFLLDDPNTWPSKSVLETSLLSREGLAKEATIFSREEQDQVIETDTDPVTQSDIDGNIKSEVQQIINLQKQYFPEETKGKITHLSRNLKLFKDVDGVLRSQGRLTHSDLTYEAKHPILLPKDCEFTNQLIKKVHEENYHVGVPHTLSQIRLNYWIPNGRAQVHKVISKCAQCIKQGGGPYNLPGTPALPPERVTYEKPFTYVGVDYFGPMYVKTDSKQKRWICLFTCLVVRAINLEVVKDMSTEECLLAFKRFVATRGAPILFVTDNALQFKLLAELVTSGKSNNQKIQWKFIPQLAPWHGGVYERLVGVVKHCLRRTLQKHLLNDSQLLTIIKEVETVVNTRPLTHVGADLEHIITPANFLTPGRCLKLQLDVNELPDTGTAIKQQLIDGWKRGETIMNEYKEMFTSQYLLSLRERYDHSPRQVRVKAKMTPHIGDVVQIRGENKNRETWKVGRISELITGSDGYCRVAKVKVGKNIFTRSIAHLYPLETDENLESPNSSDQLSEETLKMDYNATKGPSLSLDEVELSYKEPDEMDVTYENEATDNSRDVLRDEIIQDSDMGDHVDVDKDCESENQSEDLRKNESLKEVESSKRASAIQAMERIKRWTRHLLLSITPHH